MKYQVYPGVEGVWPSLVRMWSVSSEATNNPLEAALLMSSGFGFHVQLFLVVSGFVLAFTDMHRAQPLSYAAFMRRRTFKLLPLYYAFVLLLGIIGFYESRRGNLPWIIGSSREDLLINLLLIRNFSEAWVWIYPGPLWFVP